MTSLALSSITLAGCTRGVSPETHVRMQVFVGLTIVSAVIDEAERQNAEAKRARNATSYIPESLEPRVEAPPPYAFEPAAARELASLMSRCRTGTEVELGPGHAEVHLDPDGSVTSARAWSRGEGSYRRTTLDCIANVLTRVRFPAAPIAERTLDVSWFLPSWSVTDQASHSE